MLSYGDMDHISCSLRLGNVFFRLFFHSVCIVLYESVVTGFCALWLERALAPWFLPIYHAVTNNAVIREVNKKYFKGK